MVGGLNIYDTAQTGDIREDKVPSCCRIVTGKVRCNDVNDCAVETCYFRMPDRDPIHLMKEITKGFSKLKRRKYYRGFLRRNKERYTKGERDVICQALY